MLISICNAPSHCPILAKNPRSSQSTPNAPSRPTSIPHKHPFHAKNNMPIPQTHDAATPVKQIYVPHPMQSPHIPHITLAVPSPQMALSHPTLPHLYPKDKHAQEPKHIMFPANHPAPMPLKTETWLDCHANSASIRSVLLPNILSPPNPLALMPPKTKTWHHCHANSTSIKFSLLPNIPPAHNAASTPIPAQPRRWRMRAHLDDERHSLQSHLNIHMLKTHRCMVIGSSSSFLRRFWHGLVLGWMGWFSWGKLLWRSWVKTLLEENKQLKIFLWMWEEDLDYLHRNPSPKCVEDWGEWWHNVPVPRHT